MNNKIILRADNYGSFLGPLASPYSYRPELRAVLDKLYAAACASQNRAFVLEGTVTRAAQRTEDEALAYMADDRVLVIVELSSPSQADTTGKSTS